MKNRCSPLLWIALHLIFLVDIAPCPCGAANYNDDSDVDVDPSKRILVNGDFLVIGGVVFQQPKQQQQWQISLESSCEQGNEMACHYDETLQRVKASAMEMEELTAAAHRNSHSDENLVNQEFDLVSILAQDLLLLGSFHREHLDHGLVSALEHDQELFSDGSTVTKEHYARALGAFHAALYYYGKIWSTMNDQQILSMQDVYDLHPISLANVGVALQLSDLYERYYQTFHETPQSHGTNVPTAATAVAREGYSLSYRYLLSSEYWCVKSQSLLESITSREEEEEEEKENKNNIYNHDPYEKLYRRQLQEQHQLYVYETKQSLAATYVRLGTLLMTMYAEGYILTPEEMLTHDPVARSILLNSFGYIIDEEHEDYTEESIDNIKQDQERLLLRIIDRIKDGIAIYDELDVNSNTDLEDNRINLADSHYHLGMAYQYLTDYTSAISEWGASLDLYRKIFDEYTSSSSTSVESVVDVVQSLIATSQQCCDALLSMGRYDETKEHFRLHLKLRRYLEDGVSIEQALDYDDADDVETDVHDREEDSINFQYDQFLGGSTQLIDDSLHQHQMMLDEYHKTLLNHPDGSYHEMAFDIDGSYVSSMATSDRVYEGSLRSVIGSLYLAKNDVRAARDELELAVLLLRKGMEDDLHRILGTKAQDIDGNESSIPLYLADALLNLSYAQYGLKQWHRSMSSFEDALDIFAKELPEGQNPFDYKDKDRGGKSREPLQRDNLLERLKGKYSIKIENFDLRGNSSIGNEDDN